jgi:iron complex transport system substrate-binding protein
MNRFASLSRRTLVALSLLGTFGVLSPASADEIQPVDASRIVSVGTSVTEIIFDLGLGDKVVARDSTSTFPEAAARLPDVGYVRALSPEGVLSVNPSAIVMLEGAGPKSTLDVLANASVPVVTIPEGYDTQAIVTKIRTIGKALDAETRADELAARVAADIEAAHADAEKVAADKRKRVLFVLAIQNGKIMAAGQHTAADGILKLAGAINATGDFHGYKQLNDEAILAANPDAILLMMNGGPGQPTDDQLLGHPAVALTPAGKDKALIRMNGQTLLGFGPRTAEAVRELSKSLYGE